MKKLMILGAGTYQVPLIRTAKQMGLYTIVVSIPGNYPGFAYADKIYEIDTRDFSAVLKVARAEEINGICTSGTDVAVSTIGYVCQKMGLTGIPYEASLTVTNKALMKEAFLKHHVCTSQGIRVYSAEEALQAAEQLGYPVVVKRVDSSGSRGITVVRDSASVADAYKHAVHRSLCNYALVEGFMSGNEIGVDGFVLDGKLAFLAPHDKFVYQGANITIPVGHAFPYPCTEAVWKEIAYQMQTAITASGIDNCSVNADVFVDGETVSIIEIGGRTGATCIPELISMYYGFDFYEKMILNALGESPDFVPAADQPCMAKLLLSPVSGMITSYNKGLIQELQQSGIQIALDYPVGHFVTAMEDGTDRIGHVIAAVDTEEKLEQILSKVRKCIYINEKTLEEIWDESQNI